MSNNVKAVRTGDKIMLFINGKRTTLSRKVAPEAFDRAVKYIKEKDTEALANMFSNVNEKITEYAKGIFEIKDNNVYAIGEDTPTPKLVARTMFEMMSSNENPEPLLFLNKKMNRNQKGVASGMEVFAKLNNIPMTKKGNLVLKISIDKEKLNDAIKKHGIIIGGPRSSQGYNGGVNYDLPVNNISELYDEEMVSIHCLVDPSDIVAFFENTIRVCRFKVLENFIIDENKAIIEVPHEELYNIAFDIWEEHKNIKIPKAV